MTKQEEEITKKVNKADDEFVAAGSPFGLDDRERLLLKIVFEHITDLVNRVRALEVK